eukprot:982725_1
MGMHTIQLVLFTLLFWCLIGVMPGTVDYTFSNWITVNSTLLPRSSSGMAIGYDNVNHKIWLLGGSYPTQVVSYENNDFIDHGLTVLTRNAQESGQYFTQIDNVIYMANFDTSTAARWHTFDVQTQLPDPTFTGVTINIHDNGAICMSGVSVDGVGYIFFSGGYYGGYQTRSMMYTVNGGFSALNAMYEGKGYHSCIVYDGYYYVFGGKIYADTTKTIERLNIRSLPTKPTSAWPGRWGMQNGQRWNLLSKIEKSRAVAYGKDILIFGGPQINIFSTETLTTRSGGTMNYVSGTMSIVIVYPTVYAFGAADTWQYLTLPPSEAPTSAPTTAPTTPPTLAPTRAPFPTPTAYPTNAPTVTPSDYPTLEPTLDPSSAPTSPPTVAPSESPTTTPDPSENPTSTPTLAPTIAPSSSPSLTPSATPSTPPTSAPTTPPTIAPSFSPTRVPVAGNAYDHYVPIRYLVGNLTIPLKRKIAANKSRIIPWMETIIEGGYFNEEFLEFNQFEVAIDAINDEEMDDISDSSFLTWGKQNDLLAFDARVFCKYAHCVFIANIDHNSTRSANANAEATSTPSECNELSKFQAIVQCNLAAFFARHGVIFTVHNAYLLSSESVVCFRNCDDPSGQETEYVFYTSLAITGTIILFAMFAFLFNKGKFPNLPGFHPVDDAQWLSVIIFAVQFWDFTSDVNLCVELWGRDLSINMLILISAIGSTAFVIIPYLANLIIAINIKKSGIIRNNESAKTWFQANSAMFGLLVVLTGGCYPALALVSSNIFGLNIMNSGLTLYELGKLSKIKVFGTVILENVPQLAFQALYAYSINEITETVGIAFFASVLSVTASTLSYLIDRDTSDLKVVTYYASIECLPRSDPSVKGADSAEEVISDTETAPSPKSITDTGITAEEKENIMNNRGRTEALSQRMAESFCIQPKNIQIGSTIITKYGAVVHVVQFVYDSDLEMMQSEFDKNKNRDNNHIITPQLFISQLYVSLNKEITTIFRAHFGLNDEFEVKYNDTLSIKKKKLFMNNDDAPNEPHVDEDGIGNVLKRMVSDLADDEQTQMHLERAVTSCLHKGLTEQDVFDQVRKILSKRKHKGEALLEMHVMQEIDNLAEDDGENALLEMMLEAQLNDSSAAVDATDTKDQIKWVKRKKVNDEWNLVGPRLLKQGSCISCKMDTKSGNSAIGKLKITDNMRVKWECTVQKGKNIKIGILKCDEESDKVMLTKSIFVSRNGFGYLGQNGNIQHSNAITAKYGQPFKSGDKVMVRLDMMSKTLSFKVNDMDQGIAFEDLSSAHYKLAVSMNTKNEKIELNKVTIWLEQRVCCL